MSPTAIACLVTLGSAALGVLFFVAYQWGAHAGWTQALEARELLDDAEDVTLADLRLADEASEPASWTGPRAA